MVLTQWVQRAQLRYYSYSKDKSCTVATYLLNTHSHTHTLTHTHTHTPLHAGRQLGVPSAERMVQVRLMTAHARRKMDVSTGATTSMLPAATPHCAMSLAKGLHCDGLD